MEKIGITYNEGMAGEDRICQNSFVLLEKRQYLHLWVTKNFLWTFCIKSHNKLMSYGFDDYTEEIIERREA